MCDVSGEPLRILQVYSSPSPGGGTAHVADLAAALSERGHEVHVACRAEGHLPRMLEGSGVRIHTMSLRSGFDIRSVVHLVTLARKNRIQLVHAHNGRDYAICWVAGRWLSQARIVFSRHLMKINRPAWYARLLYRSAARVITVSDVIRRNLVEHLGLSDSAFATIPNWVDASRFEALPTPGAARKKFGIETPYVVALIGSLIPIKGQEDFVRAAGILARQRDDTTFLAVGSNPHGDPLFREQLESLARDLTLGDRFRILDWVDDIPSFLPSVTISVVPSWCEAFSIVILESMAAGVPTVAYDVGGPGEIIEDRVTGLLVPPRQVERLAAAMQALLDSPELRRTLASAASKVVRERYGRETVISQIQGTYRSVVS